MSTKILGVQLVNSTVDNTPVGSSTPASGAFTKVQLAPGNGATIFWIDNPGANYLRLSNGNSPGGAPVTVDFAGNVNASGGVAAASVTSRGAVNASGAVSSPAFNGPPNSKTSNGYCTLPNGFILQWGYTTIPDGAPGKPVSFAPAFPTQVLNVSMTCDYSQSGATHQVAVLRSTLTNNGFTCWADGATAAYWLAIGF